MKCPICKTRSANSPHHIVPRVQGGDDGYRNLITTCRLCHDELEALADRGIPCTPTIIKLMRLNERCFEPEINTIEDINTLIHTNSVTESIKWVPLDDILASLSKRVYGKPGRPRILSGMPMSRQTKWRRKKEEQGILL